MKIFLLAVLFAVCAVQGHRRYWYSHHYWQWQCCRYSTWTDVGSCEGRYCNAAGASCTATGFQKQTGTMDTSTDPRCSTITCTPPASPTRYTGCTISTVTNPKCNADLSCTAFNVGDSNPCESSIASLAGTTIEISASGDLEVASDSSSSSTESFAYYYADVEIKKSSNQFCFTYDYTLAADTVLHVTRFDNSPDICDARAIVVAQSSRYHRSVGTLDTQNTATAATTSASTTFRAYSDFKIGFVFIYNGAATYSGDSSIESFSLTEMTGADTCP